VRARSEEIEISAGERSLAGLWDGADRPVAVAVIAPGAGNTMRHQYFETIAAGLIASDISVLRFDFPYATAGRGYPDRPPVLMESWRGALAEAAERAGSRPVVATGKSLGGRMASMVAAEDGSPFLGAGLVFFGYPLHAPGKADQPRDSHLGEVRVPMLFIQGTRDPFARFDMIQQLVERLGSRARLHAVEGGDHSHVVRGRSRGDVLEEVASAAAAFIRELAGAG
jgi:uncharacterized protein